MNDAIVNERDSKCMNESDQNSKEKNGNSLYPNAIQCNKW